REDLRALLNAGHRRGAQVARCVGEGSKLSVKRFPVFAPVALAGIGGLPDTLESRSIVIALKRRAPGEHGADVEYDQADAEGGQLRAALAKCAAANLDAVRKQRPQRVDGVRDRAADNWRALLALAEVAGGEWPELARAAAGELTAGPDDDQSRGVQLLGDV